MSCDSDRDVRRVPTIRAYHTPMTWSVAWITEFLTGDSFGSTGRSSPVDGEGLGGYLQEFNPENINPYSLLVFEGSIVRKFFSAFVAGPMKSGSLRGGAKHVSIEMAIGWGLCKIFG